MKTQNITLSTSEKIALVSNMSTMLSAGIPILETVDSLLEDAKGNQKKVLEGLKEDLIQGQHVYYTFGRFPRVFDKVTMNVIKASEEAGTLDTALKDLKDTIKKDMEFSEKIKGAMIYPLFIIGVFVVVMVVILVVVIPKISTVFSSMNVTIPLPTKIMIYVSNALMTYTLPICMAIGLFIAGIIYIYKRYKLLFIRALISLPLISLLAREIDLTRFTRSLYQLLSAGIPITTALELSEDVVIKKEVQLTIRHAKNMVFSGKKLSEGLKDNKQILPPIMIKIVEAGERSGTLDKCMLDVSEYLDYEVSNTLKTVTALIEPLLLVVVGVLIGGMMMSIIAPMYGMISQVSSGIK